jgi:AraC-like DNA-binding protein
VSLARFDHPPGAALPTTFSAHHAAEQFRINIVEQGSFRLKYGRSEWTLGAGTIFLSRPSDEYRYSHIRHVEPDTCLRLEFSEQLVGELADTFDRLPLVLPDTNRLAFLRLQLCSSASHDVEISLDALACELVDAARTAVDDRHRLYRPGQLKWYAQRIGAARDLMDADPGAQHSLWHLSSQVAMSPFLFARVFRELIGVPPHRYLIRLRLERARIALQSGMSVTEACYGAGFKNLSHFIRTFRKHFDCLPSRTKSSRTLPHRAAGTAWPATRKEQESASTG